MPTPMYDPISRPPLPMEHLNPFIEKFDSEPLPGVKFQEIVRDGHSTIVARMKVKTPNGHAFVLRRLDTGAISLTTMFRAAFPTAADDAEKLESNWVKANHDLSGSNRTGKARFAGTWVTPAVALQLADSYFLRPVVLPLTEAHPDPDAAYRKSSRSQPGGISPDKAKAQLPTPSPSLINGPATPGPAKRRRESSTSPGPSSTGSVPVPSPRRSGRTSSPAQPFVPKTMAQKGISKAPLKASRSKLFESTTPGGSDETAVEEDAAYVSGLDPEEDIAQQRELIANLKEQRAAQENAASTTGSKRARDELDAPLQFDFKEPETEERAIATNRRIPGFFQMNPERRSAAWGVAAFATAFGLLSFVPNPWF